MAEGRGTDRVYAALSHEDRRALLEELAQDPEADHTLQDVIEGMADRVAGTPSRRELELRCYHCHLPKLAEVGLVAYDWDEGTIRYDGEMPAMDLQEILSWA